MKFDPTLKMMNPDLCTLLETHVADSKGTILLLSIMKQIYDSYTSVNMPPLERIYLIWYKTTFSSCWNQMKKQLLF